MNSSPHATTTGEQPAPERKNRHRGRWIAAGTVAALVIAAGAVGIPLLVKQHHIKEYQNVSAEISQQYEKQAADSDKLTATNEVLTLHRAAAGDVAEQVTNLGTAKDPVIKKATAKKLAEAGKQLTSALAEANEDAEAAAAGRTTAHRRAGERSYGLSNGFHREKCSNRGRSRHKTAESEEGR